MAIILAIREGITCDVGKVNMIEKKFGTNFFILLCKKKCFFVCLNMLPFKSNSGTSIKCHHYNKKKTFVTVRMDDEVRKLCRRCFCLTCGQHVKYPPCIFFFFLISRYYVCNCLFDSVLPSLKQKKSKMYRSLLCKVWKFSLVLHSSVVIPNIRTAVCL